MYQRIRRFRDKRDAVADPAYNIIKISSSGRSVKQDGRIGGWSWVVLFRSGYFLSAMPFRLAVGSVEDTSPLHGEMAEASFLRQIGEEVRQGLR